MRLSRSFATASLAILLPSLAYAGGVPTSTGWLEEVVVTGKLERLGGEPTSATEAGAIWNPVSWLILDADLAWSRSRFTASDPAGDRIPGAVESVASVGLAIDHPSGWSGGARLRHFGSAPLIENDSVRSNPTTLVNLEAGYHITDNIQLSAALFDVFDSRDNDITYLYESQLPGEAQPVNDVHFHPVEPRTFRLTLRATF
jgi:outer membrane receptor protein involved in Fe transport